MVLVVACPRRTETPSIDMPSSTQPCPKVRLQARSSKLTFSSSSTMPLTLVRLLEA
ncbi:MAG: hypothetical protein NT137_00220 [Methanomassiliicoccales archaeon]|nr:hypothetical protein [Methanomassiliicoccales archaeon]